MSLVFGRYVLEERLATGGTADVFLARPASGGAPAPRVVVKRLLASLRHDPVARETFAEEARLHQRVDHPNVVRCFEAGEAEGEPYLVVELVNGADLHRILRIGQARKRPVAPPLACFVAREILAALAAVHGATDRDGAPLGIVHRDVSPSNVYLSTQGDVKLGDFGIARPANARTPSPGSLGAAIKGKFAYLAPEQVASEPVDHRADLFAVANLLAEMMLGRPLFPGSGQLAVLLAIRDVRIDALDRPSPIPLPVVAILKRALARDPGARFPDAARFAAALLPFTWQGASNARREIASLVRWARDASIEMRAVGEHPDQAASGLPSLRPPPSRAPAPALKLDSDVLREDPGPKPSREDGSATKPFAPPPSRVRTTDGRELGPLEYAKLVELVVTGGLGPDDRVDFMGAGFAPLQDIDELARHLAPRSTVTRQVEGPGAPDWHGLAAERRDDPGGPATDPGIATALAWIASRRATGVLLAQHGARRKEIYFAAGRLHHVASTDPHEMIGAYLVSRGVLERADLDFALAVLPRFGGRLGEALTGLGLLDPVAMFGAIRDQGRDKVVEVFGWSGGELSFYAGAQAGHVEFPLDLPIGPVVEAGVASLLDAHLASRSRPWLARSVRAIDAPPSLRDAAWSSSVDRVVRHAAAPIAVRALLDALTGEGLPVVEAHRAVEAARLAGLIELVP